VLTIFEKFVFLPQIWQSVVQYKFVLFIIYIQINQVLAKLFKLKIILIKPKQLLVYLTYFFQILTLHNRHQYLFLLHPS
jgi:hypothetical protein